MSFRREAHVPRGGPDGGDGGRGGDVVLEADPSISSLIEYRFKIHHKAQRGTHGKGQKLNGARGEDLVLQGAARHHRRATPRPARFSAT